MDELICVNCNTHQDCLLILDCCYNSICRPCLLESPLTIERASDAIKCPICFETLAAERIAILPENKILTRLQSSIRGSLSTDKLFLDT